MPTILPRALARNVSDFTAGTEAEQEACPVGDGIARVTGLPGATVTTNGSSSENGTVGLALNLDEEP